MKIKQDVLLLGSHVSNNSLKNQLGSLSNNLYSYSKNNLGVCFDPPLQFDKQIDAVVKSRFFQFRSTAKLKQRFSCKDLEIVIHVLI